MPTSKNPPQSSPPSSSPPSRSTPNSSFSYFTYPLSYAASGILRRLNTESSPKPGTSRNSEFNDDSSHANSSLQHQLQSTGSSISHSFANLVSSNTESSDMNSIFRASHRTASPFQPPPLTPLTLKGYARGARPNEKLLSMALAEEIRLLLPSRLQLVDEWKLAYSLAEHGVSLATLYKRSEHYAGKRGGFVLVVKDGNGDIFGAYLSDAPYVSPRHPGFFGTGECFLWRVQTLSSMPDSANLPPPPSTDTTHATRMTTIATSKPKRTPMGTLSPSASRNGSRSGTSTPDRTRFKAFPYSGEDDYLILCGKENLIVGGGGGRNGLWLDDNLENGVSEKCATFGNEPLSDEGKKFKILGVEVWYVGTL